MFFHRIITKHKDQSRNIAAAINIFYEHFIDIQLSKWTQQNNVAVSPSDDARDACAIARVDVCLRCKINYPNAASLFSTNVDIKDHTTE